MILNIAALAAFLVTAIAGAMLIRRHVRNRPSPGHPNPSPPDRAAGKALVCLSCNTPAETLTTFQCAACGCDVRDKGLGLPLGTRRDGPFWSAVGFSAALSAVALVATAVWAGTLANEHHFVNQREWTPSPENFERVTVTASGHSRSGRQTGGELTADLYSGGGRLASLTVQYPSGRWSVVDLGGNEVTGTSAAAATLDHAVVLRWMESAGLDPSDPVVRLQSTWLTHNFDALTVHGLSPGNMLHVTADGVSISFSGGGGGTGRAGPPDWVAPAALLFWSSVWLAGLWLLFRRHRGRASRGGRGSTTTGGPA